MEKRVLDLEKFPTELLQKIYKELDCLSKIDGEDTRLRSAMRKVFSNLFKSKERDCISKIDGIAALTTLEGFCRWMRLDL